MNGRPQAGRSTRSPIFISATGRGAGRRFERDSQPVASQLNISPVPLLAPMRSSHFSRSTMLDYVEGGGCAKNAPAARAAAPAGAAGVAELADALDLGSSDANRGGSSPPARTMAAYAGNQLVIIGSAPCK